MKYSAFIAALTIASTSAFTAPSAFHRNTALNGLADDDIESAIARSVSHFCYRNNGQYIAVEIYMGIVSA